MSKDSVKVDETIGRFSWLTSKSGKVQFHLQDEETVVLYDGNKKIWSAHTEGGTPIMRGAMLADGNFVLYDSNKEVKWSTKTAGKGDKSSVLWVADEGNLFISSGGKEIWRANLQSVRPPPAGAVQPSVSQPAQPNVSQPVKPVGTPASQPNQASVGQPVKPVPRPTQPNTSQPVKPVPGPATSSTTEVPAAVPTSRLTTLRGGQSLTLKQSISSSNGKVSLVLQDDGNLCAYYKDGTNNKLLWASGSGGKGVSKATLRATGELALLNSSNTRIWSSDDTRARNTPNAILLVQDDGHVIIYDGASRIWRTMCPKLPGTEPDRLAADEYLEPGQKLVSPNGKHELIFQSDKSFCLYSKGVQEPVWSTVTRQVINDIPSRVIMRDDDDLWYVEFTEWTSTTRRKKGNGDAFLLIGDDGVATIKSDGFTIWSTDVKKRPLDACEPITTKLAKRSDKLKAGEHILSNENLFSKSGVFQASLSEQGDFTVYRRVGNGEGHFLWSSKTFGSWISKVCVTWTGCLIVYGTNAKELFKHGIASSSGIAELTMQDDGNLVLARNGRVLWASESCLPASTKKTNKIQYNEWLAVDQSLTSEDGQYSLNFQPDGNFCITKKADGSKVFTNAAKNVTGAQLLCFDREANDLIIYNKDGKQTHRSGKVLWKASNQLSHVRRDYNEFVIQNDGNAVLYMAGRVAWATNDNLAPVIITNLPKPGSSGPSGGPPVIDGGANRRTVDG